MPDAATLDESDEANMLYGVQKHEKFWFCFHFSLLLTVFSRAGKVPNYITPKADQRWSVLSRTNHRNSVHTSVALVLQYY